jgi:nitric oxide reductase subunit C
MTTEEIERYIRDPKSVNPKAMMPPQKELTNRELQEAAKFLSSLK